VPSGVTAERPDVAQELSARRGRLIKWATDHGVPIRTMLVGLGLLVGTYLVAKALFLLRDIVVIFAIAGFFAVLLNPLVVGLQHHGVRRRGGAVAIVSLISISIFIGLAFLFGYPLANALNHLASSLPKYVKSAEQGRGWIGHLVRRYHVENWVKSNAPHLASFAEGLAKPALALGKGAAAILAEVAAVFALVILLLAEGPKLRAGLFSILGTERANVASRVGGKVSDAISGYVLGDLLTSLIAGVVVFVTLSLLGVPFALLFALWVAVVDFLPSIGGALAGIPTVLFALAHSFPAGLVTAVVFMTYTLIENHLLNPIVMSRTVKVSPLLVFVSVLVGADIGVWLGGAFGGFVAILLAVPAAAILQVAVTEYWKATTPDPPAATRSPAADDSD
jgi:predicted PurR-regulated permease PerM